MKLTSDQVNASTMALAFVQALLKGDEKFRGECPIIVQEDNYNLDTERIINASHRHPQNDKEKR